MSNDPDGSEFDREIHSTITGKGKSIPASYDLEHRDLDGGEFQYVTMRFDLYDLEVEIDFGLEEAEQFITEFRDELVRAKKARLEWQTDTDPETGIAEDNAA